MSGISDPPYAPKRQVFIPAPDRKRFQALHDFHRPLLLLTPDGTIRQATPAARRLLEYGSADRLQPNFYSLVHRRNLGQVLRDVKYMTEYGKQRASWLLRLWTGHRRWRWYKATVRNDPDQAVVAVYLRDVHGL